MKPRKVFIDTAVEEGAASFLEKLVPPFDVEYVKDSKKVFESVSKAVDPIGAGKKILYLTENRGVFIKDCPGTKAYTCCGYRILHVGSYCSMDCSYCILQSYFHPPVMQFFLNYEKLFDELDDCFAQNTNSSGNVEGISRFGTGEFTDSLIWEPLTDLNKRLVERFARQDKAVLELKTKTANIDQLLALDHNRKTILAWSVNSEKIIKSEERGADTLSARLKAAQSAVAAGYPVAFHFDPIIIYDGCEADYQKTIDKIFDHVSPENVVWISMGAFRYMPGLKEIIERRFTKSKIPYGEFVPGMDGKMRYFKPLRLNLYQKIFNGIKKNAPDVTVYFCMEDAEIWSKIMHYIPDDFGGLSKMLDVSAASHCGLSI